MATDWLKNNIPSNTPQGYNLDISGTGAKWNLTQAEKIKLMDAIVKNGGPLTDAQLQSLKLLDGGNQPGSARFKNIQAAMAMLINQNSALLGYDTDGNTYNSDGSIKTNDTETTDASGETINGVPKDVALDKYFQEWYSGKEGTTGAKVRGELENVFANQANSEMMLADATFQQQALQQAQTVKSITDQVRAERMARLKAGMSESQIANQDMQMMMANVNALNDQNSLMNQGRLQAQANAMNAKDQAYLAYLEQAQGGAQTGAAYSAANAGDLRYQAMNQAYQQYGPNYNNKQYNDVLKLLSGQANNS